jgi:hypothetical protein
MKAKRERLGFAVFLVLIGLPGCTLDRIAAQQIEATGLWDELVGDETFGQSFVCARDDLYRIDLGTATYARTNSAPVIFHLKSNPEASTDIISITLPGPEIQNERPTSIVFSPLPDSGERSYYFYVESPGAVPGNAITVYANAHDQYPDGRAYRNGKAVAGDLAFTAYSRETFTFSGVWHDFLSRAAQDVPFFVCYGILILGVCAGLLVSLRKHSPPGSPPRWR